MSKSMIIVGVIGLALILGAGVAVAWSLLEGWMEKHGPDGPEGL